MSSNNLDNAGPSDKHKRNRASGKRMRGNQKAVVSGVEENLRTTNPGKLDAILSIAEGIARTKEAIFKSNPEKADEVAQITRDLTKLTGTALAAGKKQQRDAKRRQSSRLSDAKNLAYRNGLKGHGAGNVNVQDLEIQKELWNRKGIYKALRKQSFHKIAPFPFPR